MQESFRNGICPSKLTLLVISVATLAVFCFAIPSQAQTYNVKITGGTGGGCAAGNTGTLIVSSGTLEFMSTGDCYFGTVGLNTGASVCNGTNCSPSTDLDNLVGGMEYVFMNTASLTTNVGGCFGSAAGDCTTANTSLSMDVYFDDGSKCGGDSNSCISIGSNNNLNKGLGVDFEILTPEPASYLLFGSGLLGLGAFFRKKPGPGRAV